MVTKDNIMVVSSLNLWSQDHLYQNLVGKDSIIGRSIIVVENFTETTFDDSTKFVAKIACCVIAMDQAPEAKMQTNVPHHGYPYSNPQP